MKPHAIQAKLQHSVALFQQGKFSDAKQTLEQIANQSNLPETAWILLGTLCFREGEYLNAKQYFSKAITLNNNNAETLNNLGVVLERLGDISQAEKHYREAIRHKPDYASALFNLGQLKQNQNDSSTAIELYRKALRLQPNNIKALNNLGLLLEQATDYDGALSCFQRATKITPQDPELLVNFGFCLYLKGNIEGAIQQYEEAIRLKPNMIEAFNNLGHAFRYIGDQTHAKQNFQKALTINPDFVQTQSNLAQLELLTNNYTDGWRLYLARQSARTQVNYKPPKLPENLNGKHILLLQDQGIGDEIFFLRFIPLLKSKGATVTYQASEKLFPLLVGDAHLDKVIKRNSPFPKADYTLFIADLPFALEMKSTSDIPAPFPFSPIEDAVKSAQNILPTHNKKPLVGITWRAGVAGPNKMFKEIPLVEFAETLKQIDATFVVLQRNPKAGEVERFQQIVGNDVIDLSNVNEDLVLMLAILSKLDDYIGVSNTNLHLRAGLNQKAKVLVSLPTDWRWQEHGTASPWFPHFTLYRQTYTENWQGAKQQLIDDFS